MLIQTQQLSTQQLSAFDALNAACKKNDGNVTASYRHLLGNDRDRPANLLYYHQQQLVGFLGAFFFSDNVCEISLMIAPAFRRQGIATTMLRAILPLIHAEEIQTILFSSPQKLNDAWLSAKGLQYEGSECQMELSTVQVYVPLKSHASVRLATHEDIPALCTIAHECFHSQPTETQTRFKKLLNDHNLHVFVVNQENTAVGKAHFSLQSNYARISDIGVLPSMQGRGLGSALLTHCIEQARVLNISSILLDVESTNQHARDLYTRHGFTINNAHDYWGIDELGLTAFLRRL